MLEFSKRLTFTLSLSSELKFTLATKKCAMSHQRHYSLITLGVVFYLEPKSSPAHHTNWLFFILKNVFTLLQNLPRRQGGHIRQNSRMTIFSNFDSKPWPRIFPSRLIIIQKNPLNSKYQSFKEFRGTSGPKDQANCGTTKR